ncbi:MAG: T9SS type A sorting domain-containing protein [candidate division Zixibacteria bacterium]
MKFRSTAFAVTIAVLCYPLGVQGTGLGNIDSDFEDGEITLAEKITLKAIMLTDPMSLPGRYRIEEPLKDGTLLALDIFRNRQAADEEFKIQFPTLLSRVEKQTYFDSPGGYFRIHFDTTGGHAVYEPDIDIYPPDGIPDYVNRTAEYLDLAWNTICDTLIYDTPPYDGDRGGGQDLYDVYMHHYAGAYGVTFSEFPSSQRPDRNYDYTSYIYVDPTYSGFGYEDRTLPMKVTSAHEFFHAVQFAYSIAAGGWYMENCATWIEDIIWDNINDNYAFLSYFLNFVHRPINTVNGAFEYGAFIWPMFLYENWGHDFIRTSWEYCIGSTALNALESTCGQYGTLLEEQYSSYSLWNFLADSRDDGDHYEEGAEYNPARIMRTHSSYPVENESSFLDPTAFGCNNIIFSNPGEEGDLRIVFDGRDSDIWHAQIIMAMADNDHTYDAITLNDANDGEYTVEDFGEYVWVGLVTDLIDGSGGDYLYSAYLVQTDIDERIVDVPDDFILDGNYPNPFNGRTVISLFSPDEEVVNLSVYNILGEKVVDRVHFLRPGNNRIELNFEQSDNAPLASGVYFYRIESNGYNQHSNMLYLK